MSTIISVCPLEVRDLISEPLRRSCRGCDRAARGETIFWWHFSLAICGLGRVLMSFAQVRSLDPPLEDSEQPAPGETDASGDAAYGDDEQPYVSDEAAFQPLQIPIKELLFRIVHGKDVKAAAGDSWRPCESHAKAAHTFALSLRGRSAK